MTNSQLDTRNEIQEVSPFPAGDHKAHINRPNIYVLWSTSELRVRLAPLTRLKPSSKMFYWPFQSGTSFVDFFMVFFLLCVCYVFVRVCICVFCGHLLGKGWPFGSRFWCLTASLSLYHWFPGSGVVLDCIDSWSLHPYSYLCCCIFSVWWFSLSIRFFVY